MHTYTRRRPEYRLIEGVEELCRLCMENAENAVPIFGGESDAFATLPTRIMLCVGLDISQDECLPNKICVSCYKELEHCYTFRKKCEVTYQKFKSHVLAVKEREYKKAMVVKTVDQEDDREEENVPPQRHLVLAIDQDNQVELDNLATVQLENLQEFIHPGKVEAINLTLELNEEIQTQHVLTTNNLSSAEIQATTSDLSLIMSAMLIELGVLRQEDSGLVLVDENLRTVELEGDGNTKIVLQLVEEDEVINEESQAQQDKPTETNFLKVPEDKLKSIPEKPVACIKGTAQENNTVCPMCDKRFASRSVLARHVRAHSGERPHACSVCARRFAQRAVMLRHELVHKENRPFKCPSCPKSFTQRGALAAHARSHVPRHERALALHRCAVCDKVFLHASGLSRHMSTHAGLVFPCALCSRLFNDKSSLSRHARLTHPEAQQQ